MFMFLKNSNFGEILDLFSQVDHTQICKKKSLLTAGYIYLYVL